MEMVHDSELKKLAEIYNKKGKKEMYVLLSKQYGIKNPTCVFKRMRNKPELAYDEGLDQFFAEMRNDVNPEDVFISMVELCVSKTPKQCKKADVDYEQKRSNAMEKMIRELIGERLLELSRYVTLDSLSKTMYVDESSLKNDGYQVMIH